MSANETVNVFWDGTIDGAKLPDDTYIIRVTVDDGEPSEDEVLQAEAILDSSTPRVSRVLASDDDPITGDVPITDGGFINEPFIRLK